MLLAPCHGLDGLEGDPGGVLHRGGDVEGFFRAADGEDRHRAGGAGGEAVRVVGHAGQTSSTSTVTTPVAASSVTFATLPLSMVMLFSAWAFTEKSSSLPGARTSM